MSALRDNGYGICEAMKVLPDYNSMVQAAHSFVNSDKVQEAYQFLNAGEKRESIKQFLVKQGTNDELLMSQFQRIYPIVAEACGEMTPYHCDLWCVLPTPNAERQWSQNWHRDRDGATVVKVFCYFTDVTLESGPLQYVVGSHAGNYADIIGEPERSYATSEEAERIKEQDVVTLAVPAGTLAFVNTTGLHRGGYAKSQPRVCAVWSFVRK